LDYKKVYKKSIGCLEIKQIPFIFETEKPATQTASA